MAKDSAGEEISAASSVSPSLCQFKNWESDQIIWIQSWTGVGEEVGKGDAWCCCS